MLLISRGSLIRPVLGGLLYLLAGDNAFADGKVGGRVVSADGSPLAGVSVILIPQEEKSGRLTAKTNKQGEYFFGLVRDGKYALRVERTTLVPHSLKLVVYDTEKRQNLVDYEGPAPASLPAFDVNAELKVTCDLVMGEARKTHAALAKQSEEARAAAAEIPTLLQAGDYGAALASVEEALKAALDDASLHHYRGVALYGLKRPVEARASLQKAIELNPAQPGAHFILGSILTSDGRKAEAIGEFEKELGNNVDRDIQIKSTINIGLLQKDLGKSQEAIAAFEKVIELDKGQVEAYAYLADLYLATGQRDKAAEIEERAKEAGAEDPNAVFNIGANYWNNKDYAKAAEYFRHATELDPKFALAWKNLGYAQVNLGNTQAARDALRKYLELSPGSSDEKEVRELIDALGEKG